MNYCQKVETNDKLIIGELAGKTLKMPCIMLKMSDEMAKQQTLYSSKTWMKQSDRKFTSFSDSDLYIL